MNEDTDIKLSSSATMFTRLIRPLARIMLRQNVAVAEVVAGVKQAYIDAAIKQLESSDNKATNAKVAVLTGLDRNEVSRMRRGVDRAGKPFDESGKPAVQLNRAARVVTNWPLDDEGNPEPLQYAGVGSFTELVKRHSGGIPAHSMLEELQRNGDAIRHKNNIVSLKKNTFVPKEVDDKLDIMAEQLTRLLETFDHNTSPENAGSPHLQLELTFKSMNDADVETFKKLSKAQVTSLLHSIAKEMQHLRQSEENGLQSSRTTGVGMYFFDVEEDEL